MMKVKGLSSYVLNCFQSEKSVTFVQLGLKIIYVKFHEVWTEYVAIENVLLILTSFKMAAKF